MKENLLFTTSKLDMLLETLQEFKTEVHTADDKGYDFLDDGQYFISVINPEGTNNLAVKLGNGFTLFFGGWYQEYLANEEGFNNLIENIKDILKNNSCIYILSTPGSTRYVIGETIFVDDMQSRSLKNKILSIPEFKKTSLRNAKFRVVYWNAKYNREVYFQQTWLEYKNDCNAKDVNGVY